MIFPAASARSRRICATGRTGERPHLRMRNDAGKRTAVHQPCRLLLAWANLWRRSRPVAAPAGEFLRSLATSALTDRPDIKTRAFSAVLSVKMSFVAFMILHPTLSPATEGSGAARNWLGCLVRLANRSVRSSRSCSWPYPLPTHRPVCPGIGFHASSALESPQPERRR